MTSKRLKGSGSGVASKGKGEDEKTDPDSPAGPVDIFPLVLTSATQEMFGCRADEDLTGDSPYKLLRKDRILQDLRTRAAVSDFSPAKQMVMDYPEEEMLLVYDRDFTHGQSFYLVLTVEAKDKILAPPASEEEEAVEAVSSEMLVQRSPEPQPWVSLGSEQEIQDESFTESRPRLKYQLSRVRRDFGAPVSFSCRNAADAKDGMVECCSYQDRSFSLRQVERQSGVQAVPALRSSATQTAWTYPKNMSTQYEAREFNQEEKEKHLQSEGMRNFINSVVLRFQTALQQNEIMDVFLDDWKALKQADGAYGRKADSHLKEYQSFTDLHFSKDKTVSHIAWHPTINGVIAVSVMERLSFEDKINASTKLLLNPSLIMFWSFSDPIKPQLLLESPDDISCFEFSPSDPNIIAGGCMNGQVVLWDLSSHVERLQGTRSRAGKNLPVNTKALVFEDRGAEETPMVRHCAVSAIESGHRGPITDVQWLPESFEVKGLGVPVENKSHLCVQIVTCAPDCSVMFWDIRTPRIAPQPAVADRRQKAEAKPLQNPHGVANTFKHLDLTWKPLFRIALPKIDTSQEYSPLKFSLQDNTCDRHTASNADRARVQAERSEVNPEYALLSVPSAKNIKPLDDTVTKFYIGTEDGELIYTDWKLEKDQDSGRLLSKLWGPNTVSLPFPGITSSKPSHRFVIHDGLVTTVRRSPFFRDILLTVGGWNFAVWKEGVMNGPIIQSACSEKRCTVGYWSQSRPSVFFIGKEDGNVEVWDLLEKTHEPSQTQNLTTAPITCIKPWIVSSKQHFLAVSDHLGTLHILEIPWTLRTPSSNETLSTKKYFEKEVERLLYFETKMEMRSKERKVMEAEEMRKRMEAVMPEKSEEQVLEESLKEYKEYLTLEKVILKDMGLLLDPED